MVKTYQTCLGIVDTTFQWEPPFAYPIIKWKTQNVTLSGMWQLKTKQHVICFHRFMYLSDCVDKELHNITKRVLWQFRVTWKSADNVGKMIVNWIVSCATIEKLRETYEYNSQLGQNVSILHCKTFISQWHVSPSIVVTQEITRQKFELYVWYRE